MFDAGAVVGRLDMNIQGWKQAVDTVKKDQTSLSGLVMRHEQQIKSLGKTFTVAGAAIVASLGAMVKKTADYGDAADEMYQRTGASVEILTGLDGILRKNGASTEDLATGMKFLSGKMVDANNGNAAAIKLFKDLGISVTDANGNLRSTTDVLFDVATEFKGMENGAVKTTAAVDLLGRGGMSLIPTLNLGAEGLRKATERAERFGTVLTQKAAQACSDFNDALVDLGSATQGLGIQISQALMPHVQDLIEGVTNAVAKITEWAKAHPGLVAGLSQVALGVGAFLTLLGPLMLGMVAVIKNMAAIKIALGILQVGFAALISPVGLVTAGIAALLIAIAPGDSIIEKFGNVVSTTIDTIRDWVKAIQDADAIFAQSWFVRGFKSDVAQQIAAAKNAVTEFAASLKVLKPPMQEMQNAIEWGPKNWALYKEEISRTDKILAANKDTIIAWMDKGFAWLGLTRDMSGGINSLGKALEGLGIKTKTELTAELQAAEAALKGFKGSAESTPGQVKALEDKIKGLKEAMSGAKVETKSLAEQLGLLVRVDMEKKYKDMLTALTAYKGKLTEPGEKKLMDDLIALRAALDGTKPSVVSLDNVLKGIDETIANLFTEGELADIGSNVGAVADQMQRDFEAASQGIVDDILGMAPSAELMELKFKTIGDAMGVSANTIRVACWNIQAEFLRTMGIIVPLIQSLPNVTAPAVKTMGDYFAGLYNDIASGFGNTIKTWLSGATTFKNFMTGLWGNIKDAFFTMIGQMIAQWIVGLITPMVTTSAAAGVSVAASLGAGLAAIGGAIGSIVTSLVSLLPALATAIATAATIIAAAAEAIIIAAVIALVIYAAFRAVASLFAKSGGAGDGMGRVVERQDQQTALLTSIKDFCLNNISLGIQWVGKSMDYLWEVKGDLHTAMGYLKTIADKVSNLAGAASGAISTQTQLMVVHGTPRDPEYIMRASQLAGGAMPPQAVGRAQGPINLTIPFYLDGKLLDERMLRIANGRVEWLHGEYRRSNRLIPARTIGGAG